MWKTLASKHMNKGDLHKMTGLSRATFAKLSKGDDVMISVVDRIGKALEVPVYDVMEEGANASDGKQI